MPETKHKKEKIVQDDIMIDEAPVEMTKAEELAHTIIDSARTTGNEITYSEINAMISDSNFDKDALEEIYDLVESKNISILETREPNASELEDDVDDDEILELELEEDDLLNDEEDEKKSGVIIKVKIEQIVIIVQIKVNFELI